MADTTATGTVKLEGDSSKLVIAYKKATDFAGKLSISLDNTSRAMDRQAEASRRAEQAMFVANARMENAKQRALELDRTFGKAGTQFDNASGGMGRMSSAAGKLNPALRLVASSAATGEASVGGLISSVTSAASAFGPWGFAIGAAVAALGGLVMRQREAAEAAKKHADEQARLRREMEQLARAEKARKAVERLERQHGEDQARDLAANTAPVKERIKEIEREIAQSRSGSLEVKLHEVQLMKEEALLALKMGDLEEHNAKLHQAELAELRLTVNEEKKKTKEKKEQFHWSKELTNQMRTAAAMPFMQRVGSDSRDFAAGLRGASMSGLRRPDDRAGQVADAQRATNGALRQIDADRQMDKDFQLQRELDRIAQEEQALLSLNQLKDSLAMTGEERDSLREEREQIRHEARMQRIKAEEEEGARTQKTRKTIIDFAEKAATTAVMGALSVSDARRQATMAARLQGKTEQEAARAGRIAALEAQAATLKSIRDTAAVQAIQQTALGLAALASFNYYGAGLHFASAGVFGAIALGAGAGARNKSDQAFGMQMQDAGMGGSQFGGGGGGGAANGPRGGAANTGPSPVDSNIPGSPTAQPRSGSSSGAGATHVHFHGDVYGVPKKEFWQMADRELSEVSHSRKRAS